MYKLGIIFTVLLLLLSTTAFLPAVKALNKSVNEVYYQYTDATSREDLATFSDDLADAVRENKAGASILFAGYAVQFAIAIVAGFIANKSYYKHVIAKIRNIHQTAQTPDLARIRSQREGGVNIIAPLAVVFLIEGVSTLLQTLIK